MNKSVYDTPDQTSVSKRHIFCVKKTYSLCEEDIFLREGDTFSSEEDTFSLEKTDHFSPKRHRRPRPDPLGNSRAGET